MKDDFVCPCEQVDPTNFLTNEEVLALLKNKDSTTFKQRDYYKLYNCIHCGACGTHYERFLLKQKFLEDGNTIDGLSSSIEALKVYGTPFTKNKSRVKLPEGVLKESNILLYFGCFTTVKTPKYAENIAKYLIKNNVKFSVIPQEICCGYPILCTGEKETYEYLVEKNKQFFLKKGYKEIITVCPSCYMVFKKHYSELGIEIKYFTEYLTPSFEKKSGDLMIQHACPMKYIEFPEIENYLNDLYKKSGYDVIKIPHGCCGGGVGHQLRTDIAEKIALERIQVYKEFERDIVSKKTDNYITTYCPDAFWILKFYGRKRNLTSKLKDPCELLL
jgi:Fe-S oxidoreductase